MRFIRYAVLAIIALFLVTLALANRDAVTLHLIPEHLVGYVGLTESTNSISLPLFVVIFGGVVLGLSLGFAAEWVREHKFRAEAARGRRETKRLTREMESMKRAKNDGDDVLALLDDAGTAR